VSDIENLEVDVCRVILVTTMIEGFGYRQGQLTKLKVGEDELAELFSLGECNSLHVFGMVGQMDRYLSRT
jgi:hypothetical protein